MKEIRIGTIPTLSLLLAITGVLPVQAQGVPPVPAPPSAPAAAAPVVPAPPIDSVIPDRGIRHEFLAVDEGMNHLLYVNQSEPSRNWVVTIGYSHPRDLQLIGNGRVLVAHNNGYNEYEIATGRRTKSVASFHDVSSVRRLPNGHTLLVGVDPDLPAPAKPLVDPTGRHIIVLEFDASDVRVRRTAYVGDYVRLLRQTEQGTYLIGDNTCFEEVDRDGAVLWRGVDKGFKHAWEAVRLRNGNTLASGGYGGFMIEFDPAGKTVRRFAAAGQVPAAIHPNFYAMFQLLPGGDVVVANWQGHGRTHGQSGIQIVEFDMGGQPVWGWSDRKIISSMQAVLVLDGLDTSRLYDQWDGLMEPVSEAAPDGTAFEAGHAVRHWTSAGSD